MSDIPIDPGDVTALEHPTEPAFIPAPDAAVVPAPDAAVVPSQALAPDAPITVSTRVAPARGAAPAKVVERTATAIEKTPGEALQTAQPINSTLPGAYQFTARVLVDGTDLGPPHSFEVSANSYYQADRYYVEIPLAAMPKGNREVYWSSGDQKKVELRCGVKDGTEKSLIVGLVDECEIDWLHRVLRVRGRDLTSLLIDNKTAEKFPNKTSSEVAEIIATRRGLSAKITKTTTLVGTYFQREHAKLTADVTEHDLLTFLAEQEGFSYWIEGTTLHFEQPKPENSKPFVINYVPPNTNSIASGSFINLVTKRSETLAKDIIVKVISFNAKKGAKVEATTKRTRTRSSSKVTKNTLGESAGAQTYVYRIPGLTKEQAQERANKLAEQISKHERNIRCEVPFDPIMDARTRVSLRGTGTEYDQAYFVDSIEYSGSFEGGSRMEINAKNSSPASQVTI